jgi:hypothetical protein
MAKYATDGAAPVLGVDGKPVDDMAKLGQALSAGATEAAARAPRTSDQAKLKLTTRKFIKADLQVRLEPHKQSFS